VAANPRSPAAAEETGWGCWKGSWIGIERFIKLAKGKLLRLKSDTKAVQVEKKGAKGKRGGERGGEGIQ
jgi:hypothetical protein